MDTKALARLRCAGPAWLAGWVTSVFLASALIALFGLSPAAAALGRGLDRLPAAIWKVADDMGPAAKLLMGGMLALAFLAGDRIGRRGGAAPYLAHTGLAVAAVLATLLLIPAGLSRGFGIGLTGARLDPATLPLYLGAGAAGGLTFAFSLARCRRSRAGAPGFETAR